VRRGIAAVAGRVRSSHHSSISTERADRLAQKPPSDSNGTRDPSGTSCASGWKDGRRPRSRAKESSRLRTLQQREAERSDLLRVAACVLSGTVASELWRRRRRLGWLGAGMLLVRWPKPFPLVTFLQSSSHLCLLHTVHSIPRAGLSIHTRFPDAPSRSRTSRTDYSPTSRGQSTISITIRYRVGVG
jgi:hypothetical protein